MSNRVDRSELPTMAPPNTLLVCKYGHTIHVPRSSSYVRAIA
jgi:hypothetical protein